MRSVSIAIAASFTLSLCHAGNLVGIAVDPNSPNPLTPYWGLPYLIDPITGATTLITQNFTWYDNNGPGTPRDNHFYLSAGDSPNPNTLFGTSPVNLYEANFGTGVVNFWNSGFSAYDLAYDSNRNLLYGSMGDVFVKTSLAPCSGPCPPPTVVGNFGAPIFAMGYVPDEGLYGVDMLTGMLSRIDVDTGALTAIGPTGIGFLVNQLSITDIEYDSATGRMIASAGGPEDPRYGPPLGSGKIYLLDRFTGSATLLNDHAPNFFSLAEFTPEPASPILVGAALLALGVRWRFRRNLS